jgi:uridylate kinase
MPDDPAANRPHPDPIYKRILLKVSGEALCKPGGFGIDPDEVDAMASEIAGVAKIGVEVAVVVGGGNIIRGATLAKDRKIHQAVADHMGMLGTVINGLALKEAIEHHGVDARVMSALALDQVAEKFIRGRALRHLTKGRVVIFVAGTGNPFCTTDSAASLRAAEIDADALLKVTKVDGIYDKDPNKFKDAVRFERLTYEDAIARRLGVMDVAAFAQTSDANIPIVVFDMKVPGNILAVVRGGDVGTVVHSAEVGTSR